MLFTRSEDGRADTHQRGALEDGRLEVRAGSHGEGVEAEAMFVQVIEDLARLAEPLPLLGELGFRGWHAHEPAQAQLRQRAHLTCELANLGAVDTTLAGLAADVQLQADVQRWRMVRAL